MSLIDYYNKDTKILTIPNTFNRKLNDIPKETEIIIFSEDGTWNGRSYFNQPVDNLPETLTHLTFGNNFNQSVDNLPLSLTYLTFGRQTPVRLAHPKIMNIHNCLRCHNFNQSVDNLPKNLTHLTLGCDFNQSVDNLPENLTHLIFTGDSTFNNLLNNLPKNLTHLKLNKIFCQKLDNLPISLTHLTYHNNYKHKIKIHYECEVLEYMDK
jgi:hypothetical protein